MALDVTGICKLCQTQSALLRSHILPEFLYRPLYDEKHRFFVVTRGSQSTPTEQRGLREQILCRKCEERFARYEKYAAEVMTGRLGHRFKRKGTRLVVENLDYKKFKLFQLSILWRGAVSSLEFFKLIDLGKLQDRLRQMLIEDRPGLAYEFGCMIVTCVYRKLDSAILVVKAAENGL